jgi:hypothetical protein
MLAVASLLALTLAAGKDGGLEIVNPRPTYGYLGASRPKEPVLPGDLVSFAFEVKGLKVNKAGVASYSLSMEVRDPKGEVYYKEGPHTAKVLNFLGGDSFPCSSQINVPPDTPPGVYTIRVTIQDRATKNTVVFDGKGKVLKKDFGIVRVGTFADREGLVPVPPVGVVGSSFYVKFAAVGFARDKATKQPSLRVTMRILDDKGKPTFAKPLEGKVNSDVPAEELLVPLQFGITLNRVGTFTVELTATCELCGKTKSVSFPLKVVAN